MQLFATSQPVVVSGTSLLQEDFARYLKLQNVYFQFRRGNPETMLRAFRKHLVLWRDAEEQTAGLKEALDAFEAASKAGSHEATQAEKVQFALALYRAHKANSGPLGMLLDKLHAQFVVYRSDWFGPAMIANRPKIGLN